MEIRMRLGAALAAALLLPACATVTRGTQQKFDIVSEPPGAEAKLSNGIVCTTPCHLKLRRKDDFTVMVSKAGYTPEKVVIESKMHGGGGGALAGNIIAGGIIGGVIDGTNGSLNDLRPNPVHVTLKELAAVSPEAMPTAAPSMPEAAAASSATPATTALSAPDAKSAAPAPAATAALPTQTASVSPLAPAATPTASPPHAAAPASTAPVSSDSRH